MPPPEKLKVIVTGITGMVGEGVMHECLLSAMVSEVLAITRKPSGFSHPKLKEIVHGDFFNLSAIEDELSGYDACFFCLGVSSVGMKEEPYYHVTYTLTMHVAATLCRLNPNMTFCYVSGAGTDSTEKGKRMWARVKGKTENDLMKLPFRQVFAFRPGYMQPTKGLKNTLGFYKYFGWLYPVFRSLTPRSVNTLSEVGLAMIHIVDRGYPKRVIDPVDIKELAKIVEVA